MPGADESALGLASWLRSLPDEDLAGLIAARDVRESSVKDWFDLAEVLLRPDSLAAALAKLDRATLAELRRGEVAPEAERLGLAHDGMVPGVVAGAIPELEPGPSPATLVPVPQIDQRFTDRLAAEHGYRTTAAVAELLDVLEREPAKALARGGIALPDARRLAEAMGVELDGVPAITGIAERAGLVVVEHGQWVPAGEWPSTSWGERWARLAGAWLDRLPDDIRRLLAERAGAEWGDRLIETVDWLYPLGGEWMRDRIAVYTRDAELLGITADHIPSAAGSLLLTQGQDAAEPAMATGFPPTVDTVFLQHDLSVVAPGALRPDLDVRLRALADRDGASTYRVSPASITRALALGWSEEELRAFLGTLSRTGIPQPLDYLLRETAGRYGMVRVRARGVGTEVRSVEELQLRTIMADSTLSHLGLVREGDALRSGFERDLVFWSLADARYPVAAEDAAGRIETIRRHRGSVPAGAPKSTLVERLRLGAADPVGDEHAWMLRQLDLAIRAKVALTVTIAMPGGAVVEYVLEPTSVAGGRLRARDRMADIERTLPLSSIAAIGPS